MQKRLYLLCPTDCLETVINNRFKNENYFYSSLGNSFYVDINTIESITKMIKTHDINKVSFVLSSSNHIVKDALGTQDFIQLRGLSCLYHQISIQKKHSDIFWKTDYNEFSVLSYYLNTKIIELQSELGRINMGPIVINGKIYDRLTNSFKNIHSNLLCFKKYHLN